MKKNVYRLFEIMFSIIFLIIFIGFFFFDISVYCDVNPIISIISAIIILGIWLLIFKKILSKSKQWSKRKEIIIVTITMFVIVGLQIIVVKYLRVNPGWDFGVIFSNAKSFVLYGDRTIEGYEPWYFQRFPNNILLFIIYVVITKVGYLLNFSDITLPLIIFNVLMVDVSIIILYLYLRKVYNKKSAYFGLILSMFFTPLLLYSTIFYSDTISLPFVIMILYLYTFYKENNTTKKNILICIIMSIVTYIGIKIKMTVIIVFIAIVIDMILNKRIKNVCIQILSFVVIFLSFNFLFTTYVENNSKFEFKYNNYGNIPITHWIMMGIEDPTADNTGRNSYGGYNSKDYKKTLSFENAEQAKNFNIKEIKSRIEKYGLLGYSKYLLKKAVNCWGDGTYFSSVKINIESVHKSDILYSIFGINQKNYDYYLYFAQGVQFAFFICLLITSIKSILKCKFNNSYIRVAIFGIMIFLLIWENRSRYLLNFIPLFIIIIIEFMNSLKKEKNKKEKIDSMNFFKTLIKNRKLAFQLGKNDFRNRFANTSLGAMWGFLQPFVFMMMYVIVFQFIFGMQGDGGSPYVVWFLPGMAIWQCLNDSIMSASSSIRNYSYLVKKVVFPIDIIPIISLIGSSFVSIFLIIIALVVCTIFGYTPNILMILYVIFALCAFIIAFTRLTSALTTLVPDFSNFLGILMQLFFWATPVVWSVSRLIEHPTILKIIQCMPFSYLVTAFRQAFMGENIILEYNGFYTIVFWIITIFMFLWGNYVFKKSKKDFADVL
ncbi:MAG: ABC transporter permease [Candidatus Scatovivens sp.]